MNEYLKLSSPNYATITGKRLFIVPNISNRKIHPLPSASQRNYPIFIKYPSADIDSVSLELPIGYQVEAMPHDIHLQTKFGTYDAIFKLTDTKLEFIRKCSENSGTFPPSEYNALADFYATISKSDKSSIVLVKKN